MPYRLTVSFDFNLRWRCQVRRFVFTATMCGGCVCALAAQARAEELVYAFDMEDPIAWSDVVLPWGGGGFFDWTLSEGGHPGKALRITTETNQHVIACEGRCLHINHEPGTPARIQADIRLVRWPEHAQLRLRWYDGYTTSSAFEGVANEEFDPWPAPIWDSARKAVGEWHHLDVTTPPLEHPILSLAVMVQDSGHDTRDNPDATEYADLLIDNLRVDTVASTRFRDPGFDWHGKGVRKMIECRWGTGGRHIDWCDFMQEEDVPAKDDKVIHYRLSTFRDTGAGPPGHAKHDYEHSVAHDYVGGLSVISLSNIHADAAAASWGVRQTFAYSALGLKPGEPARISIKIKDTVHDPEKRHWARLLIGCNARGDILPTRAIWSPETTPNWDENRFQVHALEFERPTDATAMTVWFKMRDGHPAKMDIDGKWVDDPDSEATRPGCRGMADWVLIRAEPGERTVDSTRK
jgi:hypothetical protein